MNPKTYLNALLAAGLGVVSSHAEVTLTFDDDLQGFVATEEAYVTSVEHSDINGGSMAISASGGWAGNSVQFGMADEGNEAFFDEVKLAETNGGTLSFDLIVRDADVVIPVDGPGWFEVIVIGNSAGGWDQNTVGFGVGSGSWPLDPDEQEFQISIPVVGGDAAEDGSLNINTADGWANLQLGLNNQSNDGTGTNGVSTEPGSVTLYIDNITITAKDEPTPPPSLGIKPAVRGLNLISSSAGIYDRRMVRTTSTANSWIGVATAGDPVTYSFTVKDSPQQQAYGSFIYLIPSIDGAEIPDYTDPDYQCDHGLRFTFQRNTTGEPAASGSVAYKVASPNSNGPDGNQYWTDDTAVPSTGLGGTLANVGSADIVGTWSLTFTSDTDFTVEAPDGTTTSGAMLPETAALFDAEMNVYFGNVPGNEDNIALTTVYSNITISGVDGAMDENFTDLIEDGFIMPDSYLQVAPEGRSGVFVVTDETDYWHQWTLPANGYILEQSLDLGEVEPWDPMLMENILNVTGTFSLRLLDNLETLDSAKNFFRMAKPEPEIDP